MIYTPLDGAAKRCTPMQVIRLIERERFDAMAANGEAQLHCIGSACAQWRWYDTPNPGGVSYVSPGASAHTAGHDKPLGSINSPILARGFCGLAGPI